ncbi:MAG: UDP-4-amino-4,6-dideoxy-N-acetyl-beta-L-altrosamine transaminase [Cyclobacteriaceae bacterium]
MKVIPYGRQNITKEDIEAVVETLQSDYLTQGPKVNEFEKAFADYAGSKYAVAVANGTAALHLCALAVNVQEGQKVITTPITFAASANCVRYCGGEIVFADIDPETYLLDIVKVKELLTTHPKGTFKGIIPVDFAGRGVELEDFKALADEHELWIIEDSCHAPGGYYIDSQGVSQQCGNGKHADLAIFSFHPVKHIAAGEGGMITTNNEGYYKRLLTLRTHGITKEASSFRNSKSTAFGNNVLQVDWPGWYMEMQELGFNYRLTDIQAALGKSQLNRADICLKRRREIATTYFEAFKDLEKIKGQSGIIEGHAYHLYVIEVDDRLGLYNHLRSQNIFSQIHYFPTHLMPYYKQFGWKEGDFPNAEKYYSRCLSLPMFPSLSGQDQEYVIEQVVKFVG